VTDEAWRPLGVETDDQVAEYDALHDGVPQWMSTPYWEWVRTAITARRRYGNQYASWADMLDVELLERMCQTLRIAVPNLRSPYISDGVGRDQLKEAITTLRKHHAPLQIADYLLAHGGRAKADDLSSLLQLSKSAYVVGHRTGRPGLTRRVPQGVQVAADAVMTRGGQAGIRLAKAWEELYGITPNASEAYRLAILAVEDAAIPVASPQNSRATLGTVLSQLEDQGDWKLPMGREHNRASSPSVVIAMMRMLWHGQHDRHGGQPSAPGNVSLDEARVAVALAVALVDWFDAGLIQRAGPMP
jgi:hypothetical protein